jgi:hypothetical protein
MPWSPFENGNGQSALIPWIENSEIPTARLRALNVAIGALTQWVFNFIIARTVLTMQVTMGTAGYVSFRLFHLSKPAFTDESQGMFFLFGTFGWIMGIFVWFFIPETKGISLEKMDELFGMTQAVKDVEDRPSVTGNEVRENNAEKA